MAEIEQAIQEQDFMPVKQPKAWQKFLMWLKTLTPKHKTVLVLILVIAVVAIATALYFILAADEFTFFMDPSSGSFNVGGSGNIELSFETDDDNRLINMVHVEILYNDSVINDDNGVPNLVNPGESAMILRVTQDRNNNRLIIEGTTSGGTGGNIGNNQTVQFAVISFTVRNNAPLGSFTFALDENATAIYELDNNNNQVLVPNSQINNPGQVWTYRVESAITGGGTLRLDPNVKDISVGESFDVDVKLQNDTNDVVAVSTDIKYDPALLSLTRVIGSAQFPVSGVEIQDPVAGSYNLVRGTYGNGNDNDGTRKPQKDGLGVKGMSTVATLRFTALNLVNNASTVASVSLNNIVAVKDDGAGGVLTFATSRGNYTIKPEQPLKANLTISNVKILPGDIENSDNWNVEFYWETNKKSNTMLNGNVVKSDLTLEHSATVNNLPAGNYFDDYTIRSQIDSANGNWAEQKLSFTLGAISDRLIIKNLTAKPSFNSVNISWNTVGGANYGEANGSVSCSPGGANYSEASYTLSHGFQVNGLTSNTTYTCEILSVDKDGARANDSISFTTKTGLGFDSNVVLKVEPDRICDKWLYCRSELQIINSKDQTENLCFDLGVCDEKDKDGNCVASTGLDNLVSGSEQFYKHPDAVNSIDNLSGLAKVGLDWGNNKTIAGYFNYASMTTKGEDVYISNGDFESGAVWPWKEGNSNVVLDIKNKFDSRVLVIQPQDNGSSNWAEVEVPLGKISRKTDYVYAVSMGIWTSGEDRNVYVQLKIGDNDYKTLQKVLISNYPQTIVLLSDQRGSEFTVDDNISGDGYLVVAAYKGTDTNANDYKNFGNEFYIDNVSMKSVLPVSSIKTVARTCRLYPSGDAVACDYYDSSGKQLRGWKGFCVEEDPKYQSEDLTQRMCLNWWPVDILSGETDIFGKDTLAGYLGRKPLYYCLEVMGKYPYYNHIVYGEHRWNDIEGRNSNNAVKEIDVSSLKIMKDEILTVKINDIQIDDDDDDDIGCGLASEGEFNQSIPTLDNNKAAKGTIIFNDKNKDNWSAPFDYNYTCGDGNTSVNRSAYLRCSNKGRENDCNTVSARLVFDNSNILEKIVIQFDDGGPNQGDARFNSVTITYIGERCEVLAEVVTPDGENAAWANRVKDSSWGIIEGNTLGYVYKTDYEPYGAAVVGGDITDPASWSNPLYVMPADSQTGFNAPYQVRAGSPYGVTGKLQKYCSTPVLTGKACQENSECNYSTFSGVPITKTNHEGKCEATDKSVRIGKAQCIAGDADNMGKDCSSASDCSYGTGGVCMGINLGQLAIDHIYGGFTEGQKKLQNLFAKSYRVWRWLDKGDGNLGYVEINGNTDYGWDITSSREFYNNKPTIKNIKVNGKEGTVAIKNLQKVRLQFNSVINIQQMPLTAFRIDWGDDSPITQITNLKIDPTNATTMLFHSYDINDGDSFVPRIQIEDNWGWCNNGTLTNKCPENSTTWEKFNGIIEIQ